MLRSRLALTSLLPWTSPVVGNMDGTVLVPMLQRTQRSHPCTVCCHPPPSSASRMP